MPPTWEEVAVVAIAVALVCARRVRGLAMTPRPDDARPRITADLILDAIYSEERRTRGVRYAPEDEKEAREMHRKGRLRSVNLSIDPDIAPGQFVLEHPPHDA